MNPSPWQPSFEPLFLVLALAAAVVYARAWRCGPEKRWRAWSFGVGLALIVLALNSPLGTIAIEYLVLVHLFQNVVIGDWAPVLLLLGLTPQMRLWVAERGGTTFARVVRPWIALPVWLVGWYVIHLAPVYDAAVRNPILLAVEHAVLITIGLLFWWPVLIDPPKAVHTAARLAYVFGAFVLSAFLGLALTFSPPVYSAYADQPNRLWGLSAEQDQNLGGILMSTEQAIVFLTAIVWLLLRLLREEAEAEERLTQAQRNAGLRKH